MCARLSQKLSSCGFIFTLQYVVLQYILGLMSGIQIMNFRHIHILFRYIQPYCSTFRTLRNSCVFRTLPYSIFWYIQNPRYVQNSVKAYSGIFIRLCKARILKTLPEPELCHIQNFGKFRTRGIFKILFIQAHLGIFRQIQ